MKLSAQSKLWLIEGTFAQRSSDANCPLLFCGEASLENQLPKQAPFLHGNPAEP